MANSQNAAAIIPDFSARQQKEEQLLQESNQAEQGPTENEKALSALAASRGWAVLQEYITSQIEQVDADLTAAIATGASFEAVGQRAIIAATLKEHYQAIISFVQTREEYVNSNAREESD